MSAMTAGAQSPRRNSGGLPAAAFRRWHLAHGWLEMALSCRWKKAAPLPESWRNRDPRRAPVAVRNCLWQRFKMDKVYVLHHTRSDDEFGDDAKLIGVYRSREGAAAAATRLTPQPGFRDHPAGFHIDGYVLDRDHWVEGFFTDGGGECTTA